MIDISLNKVNKSYGFDKVLNNIDLIVKKGEKVALIGSNGSGKSTILKIVGKVENVSSGEVSIRKGASIGLLSQVPVEIDIKVKDYIYDTFKNLSVANYYYINIDAIPNLIKVNLTDDEIKSNFELKYINKDGIIDTLKNSLKESTRYGVTRDTIDVIEEFIEPSRGYYFYKK